MDAPLIFTNTLKINSKTVFPNLYAPSSNLKMQLVLLPVFPVTGVFGLESGNLHFAETFSCSVQINKEYNITACFNFSLQYFARRKEDPLQSYLSRFFKCF